MRITTSINRYHGELNNDPINPDYIFFFDKTIATQNEFFETSYAPTQKSNYIFTSVIDTPPPGYYWYILELKFEVLYGGIVLSDDILYLRSLTAQVVKQ